MDVIGKFAPHDKKTIIDGFVILLLGIGSITQWCTLPIANTVSWWLLDVFILYTIFTNCKFNHLIQPINIFLTLLVLSALYGLLFQAQCYWDYKLLVNNLLIFSLPLVAYTANSYKWIAEILNTLIRFSPFVILPLIPFLESDAYGKYFVPFTFLSLFLVFLNTKNKIYVIIISLLSISLGQDSRSDIIKTCLCLLFGMSMFLFRDQKKVLNGKFTIEGIRLKKTFKYLTRSAHIVFILSPMVFVSLAIFGGINIFNIGEDTGLDDTYTFGSDDNQADVLGDTRTFIYIEEFESALVNNYIIQGRSIARGYDTSYFTKDGMDGKYGERADCEVSILNIFNYYGIIGVIVYFWIFFMASYKAIYKSRNHYIPIIGVYVSFRWAFAFIEDFTRFDINMFILWIMIGMCYSPLFRNMTNKHIKSWIHLITNQSK